MEVIIQDIRRRTVRDDMHRIVDCKVRLHLTPPIGKGKPRRSTLWSRRIVIVNARMTIMFPSIKETNRGSLKLTGESRWLSPVECILITPVSVVAGSSKIKSRPLCKDGAPFYSSSTVCFLQRS